MARKPRQNGIYIGEDSWISLGDFSNASKSSPVAIDPYLTSVMPFFELLETVCMADCCGIDAYSFEPETIRRAISGLEKREIESLSHNLDILYSELEALHGDFFVSIRLNQYFPKLALFELLNHLRAIVNRVY